MSTLTLKRPKGWFAAGVEVAQALAILSDGAFKVFVYLCLEARRDQGVLTTSQTALARALGKSNQSIRKYLKEMESAGVCRLSGFTPMPHCRGRIEIRDDYWPYRRQSDSPSRDVHAPFVAQVRKLLAERACVHARFSAADEALARRWAAEGISVQIVEHAVLLGCARKYVMWRNHHRQAPIASLRYFEPIVEEIAPLLVSPEYWDYVRSRMERIERLWRETYDRTAGPSATSAANI